MNFSSIFLRPGRGSVAALFLFLMLVPPVAAFAGIVYVDKSATGLQNGSSWTHAFTTVQEGIDAASSGDQVWVAKGTYTPAASLQMKNGVTIIGGLGGWEYPEIPDMLKHRDFSANPTVLNGNNNKNVFYHPVPGDGETALDHTAVLDGFTIKNGKGDYGGGIFNDGNSPVFKNCFITSCVASFCGNAVFNRGCAPKFFNCKIQSNTSLTGKGGGIYNSSAQPVFIACLIYNNMANYGAGMYSTSSTVTMKNCRVVGNSTTSTNYNAKAGAGMHNSSCEVYLTNCDVNNNSSVFYAPGIYNGSCSGTFLNCLVYSNSSRAHSNTNIYNSNSDITSSYTSSSGRLEGGDPDTTTEQTGEMDYHGNPRIYDGDDDGVTIIDKGYFEYSPDTDGDGLVDSYEKAIGTDISLTDTDGDGMPDDYEDDNSLDPTTNDAGSDLDNDGLTNKEEYDNGTLPYLPDTDHDNMPDCWEVDNGLDPLSNDQWGDLDNDGYANYKEYIGGSLPNDGTDLPPPLTIYVNDDATGENTGLTWTDAFLKLSRALDFAGSGDTIFMAAGTYTPGSSRSSAFQLENGVRIYGGFAGNEPADYDLNLRDFSANQTVLSGEIGSSSSASDNCYHVFAHLDGTNLDATAVLDGVTISGGYADGSSQYSYGGGMLNVNSSPTLRNCRFESNYGKYGGGVANTGSASPTLVNTVFLNNQAGWGGGMYSKGTGSPDVINCTFTANTADYGAGLYNYDGVTPMDNQQYPVGRRR